MDVASGSLPIRRSRLVPGAPVTGAFLAGALVLAGCAEEPGSSGDGDSAPDQSSEETVSSTGDSVGETDNSSGQGVIDVEGGYTQEEQLAELEAVVGVMRERFGEDVATIDGGPWTAERHDAQVAPRPQGDGVYRHKIIFNVSPEDLEETYATAEEIAAELGLSENLNNSNGLTVYDEIFYGAGHEEERTFVMTGESAENFRATYSTRRSDHETIQEASERIREQNREQRREEYSSDNPPDVEDLQGDGERDGSSD